MLKGVKIAICTVAAMLLIAAVPTSVKAATTTIPDTGIEWEIVGDTLYVTYTGSGSSVIPDYSSNGPWGAGYSIKKVVIGSGITEIGGNAFHNIYNLNSVLFKSPSKVTKIGGQAFAANAGGYDVVKGDIVIPDGVISMANTALGGHGYEGATIYLPPSLDPDLCGRFFIHTGFVDATIILDNVNFATKDRIGQLFGDNVYDYSTINLQVPAEKLNDYKHAVEQFLLDKPITIKVTPIPKKQGSGSNAKPKKKVSIDLEEEEEEPEIIDYDTYKSDYPSGTIITISKEDKSIWSDMKAHPTDEKNLLGQKFLMYNFCGPDAKEIITKDIFYPTVGTEEKYDGQKRILTWRNLPNTTEGPLTAVVYNEKDKAYVIKGFVDKNGTAIFYDFIYRAASTITIVSQ